MTKALRLATQATVPFALTRNTPLKVPSRPCEQPAPASRPYRDVPMNFTSATPLTRLPRAGPVWLEGRPLTTVDRTPAGLIFEIRAVAWL
jgi:hypothetical protein